LMLTDHTRGPSMHRSDSRRGRTPRHRLLLLALMPGLALGACDDLTSTSQQAPSRVIADQLYTPANAQLLLNSAIGDFECALANYIVAGGLVGDELADAQLAQ